MGTLVNCRIGFMRADRNAVKRAILRASAVVCTLIDCATDCLIAMGFIHEKDLFFDFGISMTRSQKIIRQNSFCIFSQACL